MDKTAFMKDIEDLVDKHTKSMEGSGLAGELAKLTLKDAVSKKSKGEKSFFELSNKDKAKQFKMAGKVLENAPYKISGALERTKKKVFGKGVDAVKAQQESVTAPKAKERDNLLKGSPEAKEWGRMMAERRKAKKKVGGKDSLPPSTKHKMQGSGAKEDAEMYAKNPLLMGFDAGVGLSSEAQKNTQSLKKIEKENDALTEMNAK